MCRCPRLFPAFLLAVCLSHAVLAQNSSTPPPGYNKPTVMAGQPVPADSATRQLSTYNTATIGAQPQLAPGTYGRSAYAAPPPQAPIIVQAAPAQPTMGGVIPGGWGFGPGLGMVGAGPGVGYGAALQGLGSYTQAQGQYWNDIESARMSREQVKQTQIDTARKRMQWEMEYEANRPTTAKMVAAERVAELDWARNNPPLSEIWSGRTFNVLLRSILDSRNPLGGPNIVLDPPIIRALNLTDGTTRANLSLAKDEGKIDWPEALLEKPFDELREAFNKHFAAAVKSVNQDGKALERNELQQLRDDLSALDSKLDDMVRDLSPSQFIGARRLLNQLNDTVKGFGNTRVARGANQAWRRDVRTVAQLVNHCMRNGLQFGPAVAPDDEPYYTAAYYAIRAYEGAVASSGSR